MQVGLNKSKTKAMWDFGERSTIRRERICWKSQYSISNCQTPKINLTESIKSMSEKCFLLYWKQANSKITANHLAVGDL